MGLLITVKDADFSGNAVGYVPPVPDGLEYINFFGGSSGTLTRNLAPDKPEATVSGSPIVLTQGAQFGRDVGHIQTQVSQGLSDDVTFIVVAKAIEESSGVVYIGNTSSDSQVHAGTTLGRALFSSNGASDGNLGLQFQSAGTNGSTTTSVVANMDETIPGVVVGSPFFGVGRHTVADDTRYVENRTLGNSATVVGTGLSNDAGQPYRIGTAYQSNLGDDNIIYAAAIYSRALTATEIDAIYASFKARYDSLGITI